MYPKIGNRTGIKHGTLIHADKRFSKQIEHIIKMDMNYRYETFKYFIKDIGVIKELNNLHLKNEYYKNFDFMGYESGILEEPILVGANGRIKDKKQIFVNGFFKNPDKKVKFGVLYPEGCIENAQNIARGILDFATAGKYNKKENKYISKNLINIGFNSSECVFESYKFGDITEYKATARKLKQYEKVEFVIAVILDMNESKIENPYNPLKIEKTYGDIDMKLILKQIYSLSQIHIGSTKSLRLPITTGYADKIGKAIEYILQGVVDNRLFFL